MTDQALTSMPTPQLTPEQCERAYLAGDVRFDGRFFLGVITTGIYCRPICPAPAPKPSNVRYYANAAAAQDAGFRPCLRCKPEQAPPMPEWSLGHSRLSRALRLVDEGYLDTGSAAELARELGLSERHLCRLFAERLGTSAPSLARARRIGLAKRLLDETTLPMTEVALQAGFGSLRRFNAQMQAAYQRTPSALRKRRAVRSDEPIRLKLKPRLPYDVDWVFAFLAKRELAGMEEVRGHSYRRRLAQAPGGEDQWLQVSWQDEALLVQIPAQAEETLSQLLPRVRRVFDLDADSVTIDAALGKDPTLKALMGKARGLRIPGAWDGFETAVRALLGQQVSVARATKLAGDMVQEFGAGVFPTPAQLRDAEVAKLGMPGQRGRAISELARLVDQGELVLDSTQDSTQISQQLCEVRGIGPWTASYVALRIGRDPDAFLDSDWVVNKVLQATAAQSRKLSEAWRPFRSYALMYLWHAAARP